jgi:hypothetical protein
MQTADGQRSGLSADWMIDRVCDKKYKYPTPDAIQCQVMIYRFSARVINFMSGSRSSPTGLLPPGESASLLGLLEQEYMDISSEIVDRLSGKYFTEPLCLLH